jgi:O-antigen ligase
MRTLALWLSLVFIFTIPWEGAFNVAELGTISRITGVLMATVWLASLVITRRFRKPHPFLILVSIFIGWNVLSVFWSLGVDETLRQLKTYAQLGLMAWILWDLYTTSKTLRAALQTFILGAYVALGSTIFNYCTGQEISAGAGQDISDYSEGRYSGAGINAVELALILALGLPVAWHLATSSAKSLRDNILRILNGLYIPASLFAITLTGSRTSLFVVAPGLLYILGTANRIRPLCRILVLAFLVGALLVIRPSVPEPTVERLSTTSASIAEGDLGGRGILWRETFERFSEHPVLGVGSGALHSSNVLRTVAHNTFLSVLAEVGLTGFTLFVGVLVIVAFQLRNQPKSFSTLWISVLAIWAMGNFSLTLESSKLTWLILSLVVVSAGLFKVCDSVVDSSPLAAGPPAQCNRGNPEPRSNRYPANL